MTYYTHQVNAKRVILAGPPNQIVAMEFQPELPFKKRDILESMPMASLRKTYVIYKTSFWLEKVQETCNIPTTRAHSADNRTYSLHKCYFTGYRTQPLSMTFSGANGHHSNDVSMAEEAVENNGFLKKTISKIWSSSSSLNGAGATQTQQQQPQQPPEASSASGGCVIS